MINLKTILSEEYPELECELRQLQHNCVEIEELEENVKAIIIEVWIKFNGGTEFCSDEQKYADFYPQLGLLIKTERANKKDFIRVEKPVDTSFSSNPTIGWISEALKAFSNTTDASTIGMETLINKDFIPEFVQKCVIPSLGMPVQVCNFDCEFAKNTIKLL